ncbi:DEAD/DEAH box helicase [Candidatus Curtissbacteria bacterium]|nr:DEAD/DEAH box helicase [Candidatus Curtissbacteria bacterium]
MKRSFSPHSFKNKYRGLRQSRRSPASYKTHSEKYINKNVEVQTEEKYRNTHIFSDFDIASILKENITARGYKIPTPIQDKSIPIILEGHDLIGIANTGTGKTAAFLVPLINKVLNKRDEKVLIIVPTRELAMQIDEELKAFARSTGIFSQVCIGGANINAQISGLSGNPGFVIATPGRLKDLINRGLVNALTFSSVVLDEVDRMLDIGFIRDIRFIISHLPEVRQSLFFSATIDRDANTIVQTFLKDPVTVSTKVGQTAAGVEQDIIKVNSNWEKFEKLYFMLKQKEFSKVLIFGRTKRGVEGLSRSLRKEGFSADSIHSNKSQSQRIRALSQFKGDRLQVLVATDIAARGLDIEAVSHVINYDEPSTYNDYIHRIGRTGRANRQGKALTFVM